MATRERLNPKAVTFTVRYERDETVELCDDLPWLVCDPDGNECDAYEDEAEAVADAAERTAEATEEERDRIEAEYQEALEEEQDEERDALISALTDRLGEMDLAELRKLAKKLAA
jgi:hypothetical protein